MSTGSPKKKEMIKTDGEKGQHIVPATPIHWAGYFVSFDFRSDVWHALALLRPHERDYDAKIVFSDIPEWLRDEAKHYVVHLCSELAVTAPGIRAAMSALRYLGRMLPNFGGRPIDLRKQHAWEIARQLRSNLGRRTAAIKKVEINKFMMFIRHKYPDSMNDFQIFLPPRKKTGSSHKPLGKSVTEIVETDVSAHIIDACICDLEAYRDYMKTYIDPVTTRKEYFRRYQRDRRRRLRDGISPDGPRGKVSSLLARAIKGQAVIMHICLGRRAADVCNMNVNVRTEQKEWINDGGQTEKGILVRLTEIKISNAYEDVFCPDAFGEIALKAIQTVKELTAELRRHNPQWKDHLFITPALQRKKARVLSPQQINDYLNGKKRREKGLLHRYNITSDHITTHAFRRTRATKAWIGGMQAHEVSHDLGHFNVDTTLRHYIAGGEESRRRFRTLVEHGALGDTLAQLAGGREIIQTSLGRRHVEVMRSQGMVLHPTRYGYCALHGTGHCIKTSACYEGPTVDSESCEFHVLSPDALPALEEDKTALEASIELNADYSGCAALMQGMRNQLVVIDRNIERAKALQARVDGCEGTGSCGCKPPAGRVITGGDD